ncbi:hypothetical protein Y032_0201g1743 [Ancylostoma ceylanicum]|uniref:EB domain-containing protein n=1 Tax=Ancylostoma ceylanicum TaxID=53326 RepID=A0A016SNC6_9BILA|nr:hypothetical protein Y032_0201g1743 [Ancylostoma ceylanicum]
MGEDNATQSDNVTIQDYKAIDPTIFERHCNDGQPDGKCDETGRCLCPESMKKHYDDRGVAVSPAGQCLYTSQCQAIEQGMTCENSVCRCPNGLVFSGSRCTQSCPVSYVVDSRGVCIPGCQGNQIEVDGECLSHALAGEPCRVHAQCTGGASCLKGHCVCPQDMISNGSVCVYGTLGDVFHMRISKTVLSRDAVSNFEFLIQVLPEVYSRDENLHREEPTTEKMYVDKIVSSFAVGSSQYQTPPCLKIFQQKIRN